MKYEVKIEGLEEMTRRLSSATREDVIRKGLSQSSLYLASWSAKNRIRSLNPNRKDVSPTMLTARSSAGYKTRIFGQPPSAIKKEGNAYFSQYGTNINRKGFSYPRLHEFGGKFHPKRPVLTPAIENRENINNVTLIMNKVIREALEKK